MFDFITTHPRQTAILILILTILVITLCTTTLTILKRLHTLDHSLNRLEKNQRFLQKVYNQDIPIPATPPPPARRSSNN